jgi:hypothetical protein
MNDTFFLVFGIWVTILIMGFILEGQVSPPRGVKK